MIMCIKINGIKIDGLICRWPVLRFKKYIISIIIRRCHYTHYRMLLHPNRACNKVLHLNENFQTKCEKTLCTYTVMRANTKALHKYKNDTKLYSIYIVDFHWFNCKILQTSNSKMHLNLSSGTANQTTTFCINKMVAVVAFKVLMDCRFANGHSDCGAHMLLCCLSQNKGNQFPRHISLSFDFHTKFLYSFHTGIKSNSFYARQQLQNIFYVRIHSSIQ